MTERHYVHVGGEEGRDRLRVLARIFAPATAALLDRIEIVAGMRCLDIGCGGGDVSVELARRVGPRGAVIAIDFDGEALEIARREAVQAGLDNLTYRHIDLFALVLDEPVDVVFTRFVLTHLRDSATALRRMAGLLRPGGSIVVEDADASANFCYPAETAFDLYSRLYRENVGPGNGSGYRPKIAATAAKRWVWRYRSECLPTRGIRGRRHQASCRPYPGQCRATRVGNWPYKLR